MEDRSCKPCASGDLCRCTWLTDDRSLTHTCVTCKTPVHVWCLGKNEEGGAKTCGTCHGSLDADAMDPPRPPSWFKVVTPAPPGENAFQSPLNPPVNPPPGENVVQAPLNPPANPPPGENAVQTQSNELPANTPPTTTEEETVQTLPPLRKASGAKRSPYWMEVILLKDDDPRRSADENSPTHVCKLCNTTIRCHWVNSIKKNKSGCYNSSQAQKHLTQHCEEGKIRYAALLVKSFVREKVMKKDQVVKRKKIMYSTLPRGQTQMPGQPTWQDVALSYQGHFIVYSTTCLPLSIVRCPEFHGMLNAMVPNSITAKAPVLTGLMLKRFIEVEYEVMKDNIKELFASIVKDSKGNCFMQLFHDGVTLDNQMKCQAIAGQVVHPKWEANIVLALGFRKVGNSTGEIVSAAAEDVVQEMTGCSLSAVCGHGKQDRAALRVAGLLGFDETEACDMHDGDKVGRAALGDLVRKDGRGGA